MSRLHSSWTVLVVASVALVHLHAQPVLNLDPPALINDYISIGEFNTDGDVQGWGRNTAAVQISAINGVLRVTTTGGDPYFFRAGIADLPPDFSQVEVRLRIVQGERASWEMFWGASGATGFAGGRRIGYSLDFEDAEYHTLQFDMSPVLEGGSLTDFRVDSGQNAGNVFEVDYVRVGKVSADSDNDGLPDSVETGTGVFVDARDTGTKASVADSDGDGASDGLEVTFGTDPNDPKAFPVPSIDRYTENPATFIVGIAITPDVPTVSNGTTTGFQISPALEGGLNFNPTNGQITGTPLSPKDLTEHTVTASFVGGKTATFLLKIEVRNPYIDFTVPSRAVKRDVDMTPFAPQLHGPAPTSFSISPVLPEGLLFDTTTGTGAGVPTVISPLTTYTVTATYASGPPSSATVELVVLVDPSPTTDPDKKLVEYFSVGEFDEESEAGNFARNSIDPFVVADGLATITTTGGDPYFSRGNLVMESDYRILEFRLRVVEGTFGLRFYWAEDAVGRGMSEATAWTLPELVTDGQFHVYQVDFSNSLLGPLNAFRFDPGDGAGIIFELDYIRLGALTAQSRVAAIRQAGGKVRIQWSAALPGTLQSTSQLPGGWVAEPTAVQTDGAVKYVEVQPTASKFFRLSN